MSQPLTSVLYFRYQDRFSRPCPPQEALQRQAEIDARELARMTQQALHQRRPAPLKGIQVLTVGVPLRRLGVSLFAPPSDLPAGACTFCPLQVEASPYGMGCAIPFLVLSKSPPVAYLRWAQNLLAQPRKEEWADLLRAFIHEVATTHPRFTSIHESYRSGEPHTLLAALALGVYREGRYVVPWEVALALSPPHQDPLAMENILLRHVSRALTLCRSLRIPLTVYVAPLDYFELATRFHVHQAFRLSSP